jgi:hypothetical protein
MTINNIGLGKKIASIKKKYGCIGNAQMEHSALGFYCDSIQKRVSKTMKIVIIVS